MSELSAKINQQQDLADRIKELQAQERKLRADILKEIFGDDNVGTVKAQHENIIVTGTYGLTYKFEQEEIDDALEQGFLSEEASAAVRTKFELDKKVYDSLEDSVSAELDDYLIVKPSLPTLKIKFIAEEE